jgi:alpha-tubulin suppressor-like RCC1 family protein
VTPAVEIEVAVAAPRPDGLLSVRRPTPGGGATQISLGLGHGCARMRDATAWCWGENDKGQLGDGTTVRRAGLVRVQGLDRVEEVVAGFYASCARVADGSVRCWGGNDSGELGDGTTAGHRGPVRVAGVERARGVALGTSFGCALLDDGSARCWGNDPILVPGPERTYVAAPRTAQPIAGLTGVTRLAASFDHACAVRGDGSLWCWGRNFAGQLGFGKSEMRRACSRGPMEAWVTPDHVVEPVPVPGLGGVVDVALGAHRTCALRKDGSLWCSTDPRHAEPHAAEGALGGARQLAVFWPSDRGHVCGVFAGGALRCAGTNDRGQLGDGTLSPPFEETIRVAAVSSVAEVRAGRLSTCARTEGGDILCWEADDTPTFAQKVTAARARRIEME